MAVEWRDGGVIFPRASYAVGIHESDLIVLSPNQVVPFAFNISCDQNVIVHFDVYVGDELIEDWFVENVLATAPSVLSLQVHYIARAMKIRIECAAITDLIAELVVHKVG